MLHLLNARAGLSVSAAAENAAAVARARFGDSYERARSPELLWLYGSWEAYAGSVTRVRRVQETLEAQAAESGDP